MDSVPLKLIRTIAEAYDHQLLATDPRFRRSVTLMHEDGSFLHFDSAFLLRIRSEWIVCFTEHHGLHIYHADDLMRYWESEQRRTPIEELT
jgi:hypothetical protein